jgi:hypothetical protein
MRVVFILAAAAVQLLAQSSRGTFAYEKETALTAASEKVTLAMPTGGRTAKLIGATVYCSAAATFTLSRDGTAPTGTLATAVKLNTTSASASARVYHTSDAGAGTTIKTYTCAAGSEIGIDLPDKGLLASENISIASNSITGTVRIYFQWREF